MTIVLLDIDGTLIRTGRAGSRAMNRAFEDVFGIAGAFDGVELTPRITVAYEPVWAIGTGETATPEIAQAACAFIRAQLRAIGGAVADEIRIQYGGSVNAENATTLLSQPDIDGALVGGAALKADSFETIVKAARF